VSALRWVYQARLPGVRDVLEPVHDGDTIKLEVDLGFEQRSILPLRLRGVFAPELAELGGTQCQQFVRDWLEMRHTVGTLWPFHVETFRTRTNHELATLGRYVATVQDLSGWELNRAIQAYVSGNGWGGGIGG